MKKTTLIFAAALAMVGCSSNSYLGDEPSNVAANDSAITFGFEMPNSYKGAPMKRADAKGASAAADLGSQFIVWGEKNESGKAAATPGNLVFENYVVNYTASTAYTTQSNTKDWEYVGQTAYAETYVTPSIGSNAQTIKYWDYSASNYVFTAISAKQSDLTDATPNVKITKTQSGTTKYDKGYTIDVTADADLSSLYFSDRNEIGQGTGTDRTATNAYGGNVTMKFRNSLTQIRVGIYESIPGYKISAIKFYTDGDNATNPAFDVLDDEAKVSGTSAFGAAVPNSKTGVAGTLTVTYYNSTSGKENEPKVTFALASGNTAQNDIILGTNINTVAAASGLATDAAAPTYDTNNGAYTSVFPQPDNATNMKIKCDYTLTSLDGSNETINITGATAEIPAAYLQWQANYKYTYVLKISDNTNGTTGGSVTGLYPITFDAVEVIASDGTADYITTVSEPSITTFGYDETNKKYVVPSNGTYAASTIYATVVEGSSVVTLTEGTNIKLYTVETTDATNFPITEASVAESLAETATGTKKITATSTDAGEVVASVPAEDGSTKTISAFKWTGAAGTTYAVEYINGSKKTYKIVKIAASAAPLR